ncbi:MAG: rhomboid family intramembrane serine protease [Acidimicrobiales bacterium]
MSTQMQTCYRHGDRKAGVICQRCDRPICPACMHQASVGFHCPECARSGAQKVVKANQLRTRPIVTQVLIALNVVIFLAGIGSGLQTRDSVVLDYGLISQTPFGVPFGVGAGEWYRLVTSGFLHINVIHIAFNMLALYYLGNLLEPAFGRVRFLAVYFVSMLVGSLGVVLVTPDRLTVGASGAVFGLMGFAFMALRSRGIDPFSTGLGGTIILNLIITFTLSSYISVGGHIGGLIGGTLCGYLLTDLGPKHLRDERAILGSVIGLGVVAFTLAIALA